MKTLITILIFFFYFVPIQDLTGQTPPEEMLGVWKYEIPGIDAIGIFTPTHAAWVGVKNNRMNLNGINLTEGQKAKAYEGIWDIGISTIRLEKTNRCKTTFIHSHNPSIIGQGYTWDFELKDGYFTYWIIQADGSRGFTGKARKLAGWNEKTDLSLLNGLWKYSQGIEGHALLCGNYAIWFILNDATAGNINTSTEAGKAQAFEAITSIAAIGQKQSGKGFGLGIWHNLLVSDMRAEKQIEFTNTQRINKDLYDAWMVDAAGKQVGQKWQIQRIAQ